MQTPNGVPVIHQQPPPQGQMYRQPPPGLSQPMLALVSLILSNHSAVLCFAH